MALELKQNLRLSQQLVMTPQLQQAIKLLQLSRLELVDLIRTEMEQNPLLEEPSDVEGSELAEVPAEHGSAMLDAIETSEHLPTERVPDKQPDVKEKNDGELQRNEIDWEQYLDNYQTQHTSPPGSGGMASEDLPSLESTLTRAEDLTAHLMEQLRMAGFTEEEERLGAMIIGNLDRDGYLVLDPDGPTALEKELGQAKPANGVHEHVPALAEARAEPEVPALCEVNLYPDDVAEPLPIVDALVRPVRAVKASARATGQDPLITLALEARVSAPAAEKVLRRIQRFDPVGCGSRDLRECLAAQAHWYLNEGDGKDDPDADLLPHIIGKHLKNVEAKKYPAIAKDLCVSLAEVVAAVKLLSRLEPKPGRLFNPEEPQYITPDVYIHKVGDGYVTVLNDDGLSKLRISQHYRNALKNGQASGAKAKEYINEKLRSAVWLIRSIHQRQRTIVKVTDSIIKFQRDFLDKGIAYLKPLILRDVAEDIGMHESTVSRVTTNKYVHTPQGIYELKYFFNSSIARVGGDDIASEAVKNQIRQVIAKEPADKPFSDQKIVEILRSQNVDIARRTVAKYREVLGILPSSKRKRYY
ncbi:MAG: hypothetical protein NVS4B10_15910 [Myxococcales bacterium]